ncbi:zinc ribbon domain-containing protein [Pseudonocardia sp. KRD291]|uniref:FmdB family zinc ribbon protein n=1 Tax=Pseudonocardia sp. KRD291 TaxID=2792007 RepID=UPI001C4A2A82|nr:zinc ribbon domain-containing protein [Pseudonocardia sp. KRD291]MBW0102773.1 zinc ribbon domain-containing protein [Pseudonocardia sp. KRD291]
MPTYAHRCPVCGEFDQVRPMAESDLAARCPDCGSPSARVFGAPALAALDPGMRRALDVSGASADAPGVVGSVPGRHRRANPVTTDPRHARLPRP